MYMCKGILKTYTVSSCKIMFFSLHFHKNPVTRYIQLLILMFVSVFTAAK